MLYAVHLNRTCLAFLIKRNTVKLTEQVFKIVLFAFSHNDVSGVFDTSMVPVFSIRRHR